MRLNGGAFNAQVVNGSRRAPVYASAVAAAGLLAEGEGRVEVRGQGSANVLLQSELRLSALRPASGQAIQVDLQALGTGARRKVSGGTATTTLEAAPLGYQLWRRGFGSAPITLDAALALRATRSLDTSSLIRLRAEILFSALRFAPLHAELRTQTQLAPTVYRVASARRHSGSLGLLASLYYSRTQYGNGTAALVLTARADVGVQFLSGVVALQPMVAELAPNRRRWAPGAAPIHLAGDFLPSAVRRMAASPTIELRTHGELDPAHITAAGVRYITPDLRATLSIHPVDGGMHRRLTAGAFHPARKDITATGSLRRGRTLPVSRAATSLLAHAEFISTRPFPPSPAIVAVGAAGSGEVFVRGSGAATLTLGAALHGRNAQFGAGTASTALVTSALTALMYRGGRGTAQPIQVQTDLVGVRRRPGAGTLPVVARVAESGAGVIREIHGDLLLAPRAELQGEVFVRGSGTAVTTLAAQGTGQVARFVGGAASVGLATSGSGAVFVRGAGRCISGIGASLSVQRTRFCDGVAEVELQSALHGEVFARGEAEAATSLRLDGTGQVARFIAGVGLLQTTADGTGEVYVRGEGAALTTSLETVLDGRRVCFLDGTGVLQTTAVGAGEVYVRGEGLGELGLVASGTGQVAHFIAGAALMSVTPELDRVRWSRPELASPMTTLHLVGRGTNRRTGAADAVIDVLGESSAYINIAIDDVDTQTFVRSADMRDFPRASDERLFTRSL